MSTRHKMSYYYITDPKKNGKKRCTKIICITKYKNKYMFLYNKNKSCWEIPNIYIKTINNWKRSLKKIIKYENLVIEKIGECRSSDCSNNEVCLLCYCEIIRKIPLDKLNDKERIFLERIPKTITDEEKYLFKILKKKFKDIENKNNYFFWKKYILNTISRLESLYTEKKDIYIDLHMHSDYSIDSNQSLKEIIDRTQKLGLDIISITDHDSIKVYDELYNYIIANNQITPIIIPGVEFTIDNEEYGSQFHILQLMINPKEERIKKDIEYQRKASWIRAKKQIERLNKNKAMTFFFKKYKYNCSIEEYSKFLKKCYRPIPEYKTIMDYIRNKTYKNNINNWEILSKMEEFNEKDKCIERKLLKRKEYDTLKEKYKNLSDSNTNERFFHRLLATRGADDDFYPNYEGTGDLSVNKYNELKLNELNKEYFTAFAHPNDNKLYLLNHLITLNNSICGIELNKRCKYEDINNFYKKKEELDLLKIIGSDSHDIDSDLYNDIIFYKYSNKELLDLINAIKKFIDN